MILVPTVRHTGTHTLLYLLGPGVGGCPKPGQQDPNVSPFVWEHIDNALPFFVMMADKGHPIVTCLRHPYCVAKSWLDRDKDPVVMLTHLRMLLDDLDPFNPYYVPVDSPDRDYFLHLMINGLDLPKTKRNWQPKGVRQNNYDMDWRTAENVHPAVYDFVADTRSFWDGFYDA